MKNQSIIYYIQHINRYAFPILALLYPHLDYKNNDFNKDHIFPVSHFSSKKFKES